MAVLVPLNSFGVLERYKNAGIEEVYMGFHDDAWTDKFGPQADLNRMSGFGLSANPFTFGQMCNQLAQAHSLGIHGFVCFNAALYSEEQLQYIKREYLPSIAQAGAQGVIVSGQGLIEPIRETGVDAVVSTLAGVFNSRLVAHYAERGASRIILPRDLSLAEIQGIVGENPDLEYEVFLMRNGCTFSDSHCLGQHCEGKPSLCLSLRNGGTVTWPIDDDPETDRLARDAADTEYTWAHYFHRRTCGLCTLWNFEKLDIAAGDTVNFDQVLAVVDGETAQFGAPAIEGASVTANVLKNGKSAKVRVYKMKPKKGYRRTQGHRQPYTKVQITTINA